jgi:hypothetical protein
MAWLAGAVLLGFGAVFLFGLLQSLLDPAEQRESGLPAQVSVADRWGIGLHGVGLSLYVVPEWGTEEGMARVAASIREYTGDRGYVEAYLFVDMDAARAHEAGRAGGLQEAQSWFEAAFVGEYRRNERLDEEWLRFAPDGLRVGAPVELEW